MISVSKAVARALDEHSLAAEALSTGLANTAGVARHLQPRVESLRGAPTTLQAISMALRRLTPSLSGGASPAWVVRRLTQARTYTPLTALLFEDPGELLLAGEELKKLREAHPDWYLELTATGGEAILVASTGYERDLERLFRSARLIGKVPSLAAVSLAAPREGMITPGLYTHVLSALSRRNINVFTLFSTSDTLSLIFSEKDLEAAHGYLRTLHEGA